jgi:hypothetical protein
MDSVITANELKTKGVSAIKKATSQGTEAIISVRGKHEYVVLPIKSYNHFRECELEVALMEVKEDIKNKKYYKENVSKHIKRLKNG